jgi:hypothetical protein
MGLVHVLESTSDRCWLLRLRARKRKTSENGLSATAARERERYRFLGLGSSTRRDCGGRPALPSRYALRASGGDTHGPQSVDLLCRLGQARQAHAVEQLCLVLGSLRDLQRFLKLLQGLVDFARIQQRLALERKSNSEMSS